MFIHLSGTAIPRLVGAKPEGFGVFLQLGVSTQRAQSVRDILGSPICAECVECVEIQVMNTEVPSMPPWRAYRDLFAVFTRRGKSVVQLVDLLNEDAERKGYTKCFYTRRSLEAWQADDELTDNTRTPRPAKIAHLHEWLTEQIVDPKFAVHLAAIKPPPTYLVNGSAQRREKKIHGAQSTFETYHYERIVLRGKKHLPQWSAFHEFDLKGNRLARLSCSIRTIEPYFRFGFKLIGVHGDRFGIGSIQSYDTSRVVHIGRDDLDRPSIKATDVFLTLYINEKTKGPDRKLMNSDRNVRLPLVFSIDHKFSNLFSVNNTHVLKQKLPPEICNRVVMYAWGDTKMISVEVLDILVTVTPIV